MRERFKSVKELGSHFENELALLKEEIEEKQAEVTSRIADISKITQITEGLEVEEFRTFVTEPYIALPTGKKEEWYVAVPKFINMSVGWLDHTTDTFNVFRINRFVKWIGDIPEDLKDKFHFPEELPLKIYDGMMLTGRKSQDLAWAKYKPYLSKKVDKDKIRIKKGYEFRLLSKLIDDGILPFVPQPVRKKDLQDNISDINLRDYQEPAWKYFLETGAIGVFWPPSAGKTFLGLYAGARLKGRKLVVVPTRTLVEQWEDRVRKHLGWQHLKDWDIVTYASYKKIQDNEYVLFIPDECHHLPANTFSRFSTIKVKYRIGLSASPYREDERTDYIFALTGFPIGLSWDQLVDLGVIEVPDIRLYILPTWNRKEEKLRELVEIAKKTIIFCDSIEKGKALSKLLEIPHVYGKSRNRLKIIREADVSILSRVGDEGISLPDIERVIEIDFLYGSRRQEGQRLGRLFHGDKKGEHIILMTEQEYNQHSKRLHAIIEKGFKIEMVR